MAGVNSGLLFIVFHGVPDFGHFIRTLPVVFLTSTWPKYANFCYIFARQKASNSPILTAYLSHFVGLKAHCILLSGRLLLFFTLASICCVFSYFFVKNQLKCAVNKILGQSPKTAHTLPPPPTPPLPSHARTALRPPLCVVCDNNKQLCILSRTHSQRYG